MALTRSTVLSAECCLYLIKRRCVSIYTHFIRKIKMIIKHVMTIMISYCRGIQKRCHFFRSKKCRILTGFSPALVFHLISCGYYKADTLCRKLFHHGSPSGLIFSVRRIPSPVICFSVFFNLGIACKTKSKFTCIWCFIRILL